MKKSELFKIANKCKGEFFEKHGYEISKQICEAATLNSANNETNIVDLIIDGLKGAHELAVVNAVAIVLNTLLESDLINVDLDE